ncbi:hypothetical protein [Sulfolobus spindle-shaped virus]|nr:hypothetical protein [Sulfolobus spindle-shaped virus]AZG03983.1 hypothetical protein [Sulfolobus spindle-shaped virus]
MSSSTFPSTISSNRFSIANESLYKDLIFIPPHRHDIYNLELSLLVAQDLLYHLFRLGSSRIFLTSFHVYSSSSSTSTYTRKQ